jgi:ribosomal-protein-alanine N-acetyltransferase
MKPLPLPDPPLRDGVVALRPWAEGDVAEVATWGADPELVKWTGVPADYTPQLALGYMAGAEAGRRAGRMVDLAIFDLGSSVVIGSCDVRRPLDEDPALGEIGYLLVEAAGGRGMATRAVRLLVRWSFDVLEMARCAGGGDSG